MDLAAMLANRFPSSTRYHSIPIASIHPNSHILRCGVFTLFLQKKQLKRIVPNLPKSINNNALIGITTAHIFHTSWTGNNEQFLEYSYNLVDPIVYSITKQDQDKSYDTVQADHMFAPHINRVIGQVVLIQGHSAFVLVDSDVKVISYQWEDEKELRYQAHQQIAHDLGVQYDDIHNVAIMRKQVGDRYYQHPRPSNCAAWLGELNPKSNVSFMDTPLISVVRFQQRIQSVHRAASEPTQLSSDQLIKFIRSHEFQTSQLSSDQSIKLTYSREFLLTIRHSVIQLDHFPIDLPKWLFTNQSNSQSKVDPCVRNLTVLSNRATNNATTKKIRDHKVVQRTYGVRNTDNYEQSKEHNAYSESYGERYRSIKAKQEIEGRAAQNKIIITVFVTMIMLVVLIFTANL